MKINYLLIGKKIKKIRKDKKLSQYDLAELVSVSPHYISRVECGKDHISLELLVKVCYALETNVSKVLTEDPFDEYSHSSKGSTSLEKKLMSGVCNTIKEIMEEENI